MKRFWHKLKQVMGILIAVAILHQIEPANAGSLQIHLASEHAGGCDECNERNVGIGYIGTGSGTRLAAGFYRNSWFRDSLYVGPNWQISGPLSVSMVGITGYQGTAGRSAELLVAPLTHLRVDLYKRTGLMFTWAPTQDGGVVLLSVNQRF